MARIADEVALHGVQPFHLEQSPLPTNEHLNVAPGIVTVPPPARSDAVVVQLFLGSEGGGIITAVNQWTPLLRDAGWTLRFVVMAGDGKAIEMLRAAGVEPEVRPFPRLKRLTVLPRFLRSLDATIIHTHNPSAQLWATLAGRRIGARVVRTIHADMFEEMKGSLPGWKIAVWKWIMSWMIRRAGLVAVVSPHLIPLLPLPRGFDASSIRMMPNGFDPGSIDSSTSRLPDQARRFLSDDAKLSYRCPLVLSMGRLVQVKNFPLLIEAFSKVVEALPHARLILGGSGPQLDLLNAQLHRLQLEDHVLLLPWIDDVAPFLQRADVVAISSHSECCPMLILEAMSASKPVVATEVGGIPYMVRSGENGLLVPPNDPGALADALLTILRDPDLGRSLGRANRSRIQRCFDPVQAAADLASAYNQLLSRSAT